MGALITFKVDLDMRTGKPTRTLMEEARTFFKKELGLDLETTDQAISNLRV